MRTWNEEEGERWKTRGTGPEAPGLRNILTGLMSTKVEKERGPRNKEAAVLGLRSGTCAQSDQDCVFSGF